MVINIFHKVERRILKGNKDRLHHLLANANQRTVLCKLQQEQDNKDIVKYHIE